MDDFKSLDVSDDIYFLGFQNKLSQFVHYSEAPLTNQEATFVEFFPGMFR